MTALSPAETLTAAAKLVREHVGFLQLHDVRGPWSVHSGPSGYPQTVSNVGVPVLVANTFTDPKAPPVMANYIALMHPGVGLALADWLEAVASEMGVVDGTEYRAVGDGHDFASWNAALAAARQLLGEAS